MTMRSLRPWIVAVCIAGILEAPPASMACGPFLPRALFTLTGTPDYPTDRFIKGHLGVIQPTYRMHYLFVAYRYLSGKGLDPEEQRAVLSLWGPRLRENDVRSSRDAQTAWIEARRKVVAPSAGTEKRYEVYRELPGENTYGWFLNCHDDAFRTAALTLNQRVQRFGAASREVKSWVEAQDQVFANCAEGAVTPVPAPADIDPLIHADRAYQIAAAHFYAGDFAAAEAGFSQVAEDESSPWHDIAPYLVARTLIRKASLSAGYRQYHVPTLLRAEEQLGRVLGDARLAAIHPAAERLLRYVRLRLQPEERLGELGAAILRPRAGETLREDLEEYAYLLKRVRGKAPDDFTDWHTTLAATDPDALEHALQRLKETSSLPWLVACLVKSDEDNTELPALFAAAAKVGPESPGYATVTYHRLRLMVDDGQAEEARRQLDGFLARESESLPVSSRNLFLSLRLMLARDLDEFLKHSVREIAGTTYFGDEYESPSFRGEGGNSRSRRDYLDPAAAQFLNEHVPLTILAQVATSGRFPKDIQRDLVQASWVRAIILDADETARQLPPELERHVPEIKTALMAYKSADSPGARRFAAAFMLLRNPGLRPYVTSGLARKTPLGRIDSLRDNWWCSLGLGVPYDVPNYLKLRATDRSGDWLKKEFPGYVEDFPDFLNATQRRKASEERAKLHASGAAPNYLSREIIEWAKEHPDDSRVPEALHLAVRSTRYGCTDAETSKYSKAAFQLLHRRYPKSEWAKSTKYWY